MCITFVEDNTVCFTWEDLEYFKGHQDAYAFYREDIEEITNGLTSDEDVFRTNYQGGGRFFYMQVDDISVGEFWTYRRYGIEDEISIRVYEKYQQNGYATRAILYYLEHQRRDGTKVTAVCKDINPLHEHIIKMLKRCGFEYTSEDGGCYQYIGR